LEDSVRFLGWISDLSTLREIVVNADVGVEPCPSNAFNDSSSMIKLTEYLAAGRPVLAYDLPEHRVTVGEAGVLVPPGRGAEGLGAAMVAMANDRTAMARLVQNAMARLNTDRLSASHAAEALLGAYARATLLGVSRGANW
jgi:glycosyltransferase involved in cell wall biosynthesis